jgi:hypothetical protein
VFFGVVLQQRTPWRVALFTITLGALAALTPLAWAAAPAPKVVEVPYRPAFVQPVPGKEQPAQVGQLLSQQTLLRTAKPGRMQVQLPDGRAFRLGGDALLRLNGRQLDLQRGQIIAWVNPGSKGGAPLQIRTRAATASIVGTTVFIEATDTELKIFSWEGLVECITADGQRKMISSGQQLTFDNNAWRMTRLTTAEAAARRQKSILLNGFTAPMETLPLIEKELGLSR